MSPRLITRVAAALLALAAATRPGLAQSSDEFTLGDQGWEQTASPEPGSQAAELAEARRELAAGNPGRANSLVSRWLEEHELTDNPLVPEAYLIRGDARRDRNNEYKALFDYEAIIDGYPSSELFPIAIERELEIGLRYLAGRKRKFLGIRFVSAKDLGVEILIRVQERMPGSAVAERAAIELADYYYHERHLQLAGETYDLYLLNHPDGPNRIHAMKRRIYTDMARFKGPRNDSATLIDARFRIREFADEYPIEAERTGLNDGLIARIDESLGAQQLETAHWYLRQKDWASARLVLRRLAREAPDTIAGERAIEILTERGWLEPITTPEPADTAPTDEPMIEGTQPAEPVTTNPASPAPEPAPDAQPQPAEGSP